MLGDRGHLEFDLHLFAEPLPQANELMRQSCEDQCRALLARRQGRSGYAGRVAVREVLTVDDLAGKRISVELGGIAWGSIGILVAYPIMRYLAKFRTSSNR